LGRRSGGRLGGSGSRRLVLQSSAGDMTHSTTATYRRSSPVLASAGRGSGSGSSGRDNRSGRRNDSGASGRGGHI
jgi:hypothetical protein